jgi:hypothetical protein
MAILVIAVLAILALFFVVSAVRRLGRRRARTRVMSMGRPAVDASALARQDRMRRDDARRASDLAAASQRNLENIKRSSDRMRADAERAARSAVRRNRGW